MSGEITDKDSITFDDDIGGIKNPMIFDFDSWPVSEATAKKLANITCPTLCVDHVCDQ